MCCPTCGDQGEIRRGHEGDQAEIHVGRDEGGDHDWTVGGLGVRDGARYEGGRTRYEGDRARYEGDTGEIGRGRLLVVHRAPLLLPGGTQKYQQKKERQVSRALLCCYANCFQEVEQMHRYVSRRRSGR